MLAVLLSSLQTSSGNAGDPLCPCIATPASLLSNASGGKLACFDATIGASTFCYPAEYGAYECDAHDQGLEPYCNASSNGFCAEPWCYVDPDTCHSSPVPYEKSSYADGHFSATRRAAVTRTNGATSI